MAHTTQKPMSTEVCIHTWPCSYYLEPQKRWVPGKLALTPQSLKFTADDSGELLVSFPLCSIVELKKETSHWIFSSITVLEKGHAKHWFSSLQPSRNVVFSIIEHFWRELLLGAAGETTSSPSTRGKELTSLMASSQRRLEDTAKVLHHQGEQLDSVAKNLDKMESDLDMANRLLTELESPSWWPFSSKLRKPPPEMKLWEGASVASSEPSGKEGVVLTVPAVISQRTESHVRPGRLTVLVSGLEIHDRGAVLMHRFEKGDVDEIQIHSPYEISLRQRFVGKPDVSYRVLSARMPAVIPILEVHFSRKIQWSEEALMLRSTRTCPRAEQSCPAWHAASCLLGRAVHDELPAGSQEGGLPLQVSQPLLSEGDAQQLMQILRKLKGLALDAEAELERQEEALDGITAAVDRATLTIDKHNRRMKRLT
ncbi:synaptosomal-associated protein 47 isoform X2 [Cynocephalus volans]